MTIALNDFDGLTAIVTGGASGIGLATATELASRGARVAVFDVNLGGLPAKFTGIVADVTDRASVNAAVAQLAESNGGIDVVINNAGIGSVGTVEAYLASPLAGSTTGTALEVDGGLTHLRLRPAGG